MTWHMVKLMLEHKREELVKECIKLGARFEPNDAKTRRLNFHG